MDARNGGRSWSIIVVEDDVLLGEILCECVEDLGFEVTQAGTADAAFMMIQAGQKIDLLVTDV